MTRRDTPSRAALLEAARKIAQGEARFLAWGEPAGAMAKQAHAEYLQDVICGEEMLSFDDEIWTPTEETRHQRVVFLCFVAEMVR